MVSEVRRCKDCRYKDVWVYAEPCNNCYDEFGHPCFEAKQGQDRKCIDCKHNEIAVTQSHCKDCIRNPRRPYFDRKNAEPAGSTSKKMTRSAILTEANNIVSGHRKAGEYGPPEDSFKSIAAFWAEYLGHEIKPHDVAVMMALLKIARIKGGETKKDNWVDLAGYAACGGECQDKEE